MIKNIVIFSNCAGNIIKNMFEKHSYTKDKYSITHIVNYETLSRTHMDESHAVILNNCDIFMYQPLNQSYDDSEYDVTHIKKYLKRDAIILKVNYYRFNGFWYNSEYKPYDSYNNYLFSTNANYGIHNSFINFNTTDKCEIVKNVNNICISEEEFLVFFNNQLSKFKIIDDNSDINMFDYFLNNYKTIHLFHDPFHPTNLFFYEMFRQIIIKLENHELQNNDYDFIKSLKCIEMTHWALPILPIIKKHLDLVLDDNIYIFKTPDTGNILFMNVYDYYYIRVSQANFQGYLDDLKH